jgi:hypothetical protein
MNKTYTYEQTITYKKRDGTVSVYISPLNIKTKLSPISDLIHKRAEIRLNLTKLTDDQINKLYEPFETHPCLEEKQLHILKHFKSHTDPMYALLSTVPVTAQKKHQHIKAALETHTDQLLSVLPPIISMKKKRSIVRKNIKNYTMEQLQV